MSTSLLSWWRNQEGSLSRPGEIAWQEIDPHNGNRLLKEEDGVMIWEEPSKGTVLKLYQKGGAISELRYRWTCYRVAREWSALRLLNEHGVPCTRPVHWFRGHSPRFGYCQGLRTRTIVGAAQLKSEILQGHIAARDIDLKPLYRLVSRMHETGIFHGALWPSNIIQRSRLGKREFFLCDLPHSSIFAGDLRGSGPALADLQDLSTSLEQIGFVVQRADLKAYGLSKELSEAFLRALQGGPRSRSLRWVVVATCFFANAFVSTPGSR